MKFIVVVVCFLVSSAVVRPQGQLVFDNLVNNLVVAPVYGPEPAQPGLARQGNSASGTPSGTQSYGGPLLQGPSFTAQLFAGSTRSLTAHLQPIAPAVYFRTNERAGFVVPPSRTVTVAGVESGEPARAILRAWDNRGGTVSNWVQVMSDGSIPHGASRVFVTPPLGGLLHAPANLVGLESFNLATGAVSDASVRINFQPATAPVPAGYLPDYGVAFGPRGNGATYGWNVSHTAMARERHSTNSTDARYDTLIELGSSPQTRWEFAVTNGIYGVHLVAGDPGATAGVYRVDIEGVPILSATPATGQRWAIADGIVVVEDGRLTISNGVGAWTNRICFVEFARIPPPRLEVNSPPNHPFAFQFCAGDPVRYRIEASSELPQFSTNGPDRVAEDGEVKVVDLQSAVVPGRYFRVRPVATPKPVVVYSNSFGAAPGAEWSHATISTAPFGQKFFGAFGAGTVRLTLTDLPPHTRLSVFCDLFILGAWEGNSTTSGPDRWQLDLGPSTTLIRTTFRTVAGSSQAYPGGHPGASYGANTAAWELNVLGYGMDAHYRLGYTGLHSGSTAELSFIAVTTENTADESWGLDNVIVTVQEDPYD